MRSRSGVEVGRGSSGSLSRWPSSASCSLVLPKIASYRDVWAVVKTLTWEWVVALLAVTVINLLSNAPPWMAALPGLASCPL